MKFWMFFLGACLGLAGGSASVVSADGGVIPSDVRTTLDEATPLSVEFLIDVWHDPQMRYYVGQQGLVNIFLDLSWLIVTFDTQTEHPAITISEPFGCCVEIDVEQRALTCDEKTARRITHSLGQTTQAVFWLELKDDAAKRSTRFN